MNEVPLYLAHKKPHGSGLRRHGARWLREGGGGGGGAGVEGDCQDARAGGLGVGGEMCERRGGLVPRRLCPSRTRPSRYWKTRL